MNNTNKPLWFDDDNENAYPKKYNIFSKTYCVF